MAATNRRLAIPALAGLLVLFTAKLLQTSGGTYYVGRVDPVGQANAVIRPC